MMDLYRATRVAGCLTIALSAGMLGLSIADAMTKPATSLSFVDARTAFDFTRRFTGFRSLAAIEPTGTILRPQRSPGAPRSDEPFGRQELPAADGALWNTWQNAEALIEDDAAILRRCRSDAEDCPAAAQRMLTIVDGALQRGGRARIGEINRAVNLSIRPMSDQAQFGELDRWTSPLATFTSRSGDCEDYAIAKYLALRETGMPAADLRLVIVRDTLAKEDHAVLAARLDGQWLLLDNRHHMLVESTEAKNFKPLFAFDHEGVRRFAPVLADGPTPAPPGPLPARVDALTYLKIAN